MKYNYIRIFLTHHKITQIQMSKTCRSFAKTVLKIPNKTMILLEMYIVLQAVEKKTETNEYRHGDNIYLFWKIMKECTSQREDGWCIRYIRIGRTQHAHYSLSRKYSLQ